MADPRPAPRPPGCTATCPGVGGARSRRSRETSASPRSPPTTRAARGPHLYLRVRKTDVSAEAPHRPPRPHTLAVSKKEIGTGRPQGPSGRHGAVGSASRRPPSRISPPSTGAGVEVLEHRRHTNKLKNGPSTREPVRRDGAGRRAGRGRPRRTDRRAAAGRSGSPTRSGRSGSATTAATLRLGVRPAAGGRRRRRTSPRKRRAFLTRLALSAAQADLFNACLADRMTDRSAGTVGPGDVVQVRGSGGAVRRPGPGDEARARRGADPGSTPTKTAVTGPLFGPKMVAPHGRPAEREAAILDAARLAPARVPHLFETDARGPPAVPRAAGRSDRRPGRGRGGRRVAGPLLPACRQLRDGPAARTDWFRMSPERKLRPCDPRFAPGSARTTYGRGSRPGLRPLHATVTG